jgi:hypothetical protein
MSFPHVQLLDPTGQPAVGSSTSLQVSRAAARSFALQQAAAEQRARNRPPRAARSWVWRRARRVTTRPRPA